MLSLKWGELRDLVGFLADDVIASKKEYDAIVGVQRGGLIPAVMLSHKLKLPMKVIDYSSSKGNGGKDSKELLPDWLSTGKYLIVDDIADTGHTLADIKKVAKNSDTLVIVYSISSCVIPDFFAHKQTEKEWVEFPYEF